MKKYVFLLTILLLNGCTYLACLEDNTFDGVALPQCQKQQPQEITRLEQIPEQKRQIPKFEIKGEKDGPYTGTASNGRILKTILKNGYFDQYVDIYYPNGKLHSHTPVKMGVPEGWSTGYTEQGKLRSKILYNKGKTMKIEVYNDKGKIVKEIK